MSVRFSSLEHAARMCPFCKHLKHWAAWAAARLVPGSSRAEGHPFWSFLTAARGYLIHAVPGLLMARLDSDLLGLATSYEGHFRLDLIGGDRIL